MTNVSQAELWNKAVGSAWVRHADAYDRTLEPFGQAVLNALEIQSNARIVDVGCGAGATTLQLAERAAHGSVVGADVSEPMLAEARRRAIDSGTTNATFQLCDVETDPLQPRCYDVAFSRFGVMFFADPEAGFANIAQSLLPGGQLGFVCFQGPPANPFIVVPVIAAVGRLGLAPPDPEAPSPFSLADPTKIEALLSQAGFSGISIEAGPGEVDLGPADENPLPVAARLLEQNPMVAPALAAADPDRRAAAINAAAQAIAGHCSAGRLRLGAGTWIVRAVNLN